MLRAADFDLAADVYAAFVKQYPRSPEVPRVRLRQAFSYYAQFRGLKTIVGPFEAKIVLQRQRGGYQTRTWKQQLLE